MEWISVKDRLPKPEDGEVICHDDNFYTVLASFNGKKWEKLPDYWSEDEITHWMPFPKPTKPNADQPQ